jgi:hypothetical protein
LGSASTERITNNICFIAFWQISFLAASSVDGRQIWEKTKANQSPPLLLDSSRGQSYQFGNIFAIKIGNFYSTLMHKNFRNITFQNKFFYTKIMKCLTKYKLKWYITYIT